jgi:fructoselysine-6-P-deglycase FrlB-like protein
MDTTQWLTRLAAELGTDDVPLDEAAIRDLLDLTREAAHGVERIAGPLTTFLVGVAVGRGADVAVATEAAMALLEEPAPVQDRT